MASKFLGRITCILFLFGTALIFQNCGRSHFSNQEEMLLPSTTPDTPKLNQEALQSTMDLNIESFGAVGNGTKDNIEAITNAIKTALLKNVNVYVPPGRFAYSGVIRLSGPVKLYGEGETSILHALDPNNSTIFMSGSFSQINKIKLTIVSLNNYPRTAPYETQRITALQADHFKIDQVTIDGATGAGIMTAASTYGTITNNRIMNTKADSIHMTLGSSFMLVSGNETINSGDDGIAVVSYQRDGAICHDIEAYNNIIHDNVWGRGMTVVGGANVKFSNNYVYNIPGASCFLIAQEDSYQTEPANNILFIDNSAINCGGPEGGHGGLLIVGDSIKNSNITIENNLFDQSKNTFSTISVLGENTNISFINNKTIGKKVFFQTHEQIIKNTAWTDGAVGSSFDRITH